MQHTTKNIFKHAVLSGKKLIGGWCMSGSDTIAEAMATLPYDFVVVDLEHGSTGIEGLIGLLRALSGFQMPTVVRMPSHDPTTIKYALDRGAISLLFPLVETPEQAKQIVQSCKYPPDGVRGFTLMTRARAYTHKSDYVQNINKELFIGVQLETPKALENAEEIACVAGVDSLFIGSGDLSMSLGKPGNITDTEVRSLIEKTVAKMPPLNIPVGTVSPSPEYADWAYKTGFSYVSIGNDLAVIVKQGTAQIQAVAQGLKTLNLQHKQEVS